MLYTLNPKPGVAKHYVLLLLQERDFVFEALD